tara:strand:+ start:1020 stop:1223 length:204 start_codon:yes stop_codon:yes gene_type:complete
MDVSGKNDALVVGYIGKPRIGIDLVKPSGPFQNDDSLLAQVRDFLFGVVRLKLLEVGLGKAADIRGS